MVYYMHHVSEENTHGKWRRTRKRHNVRKAVSHMGEGTLRIIKTFMNELLEISSFHVLLPDNMESEFFVSFPILPTWMPV